jgi:YidC/Oxa1 family membrane protein insertase
MVNFISGSSFLLSQIEKDPSGIIGYISTFLGYILNFFFEISRFLMSPGSLGFAIIMLTIVARVLMFPLGIKSQHSMAITQRLTPEVNKIKKKYGDTKDPELTRKMNMEVQALYSKSGSNPLLGCLPLLITLPIFIALFALLKHSYLYVGELNKLYANIADVLKEGFNYGAYVGDKITPMVPKDMWASGQLMMDTKTLSMFVNKFSLLDWNGIKENVPQIVSKLSPLLDEKLRVESLFGINLIDSAGLTFPKIIIPLMTAAATFLSSFISNKQNKNIDPSQKTMQLVMLVGMPVMMFFMTTGAAVGVGIYWITSSLFQAGQQWILGLYYNEERIDAYLKKREEKRKNKGVK